jgi:hypothetical protein
VVNTKVAWQGRRGARFAHFHADIIAYENEQPKGKDLDDKEPLMQIPTAEPGERILVTNAPKEPPDQQEMELP